MAESLLHRFNTPTKETLEILTTVLAPPDFIIVPLWVMAVQPHLYAFFALFIFQAQQASDVLNLQQQLRMNENACGSRRCLRFSVLTEDISLKMSDMS